MHLRTFLSREAAWLPALALIAAAIPSVRASGEGWVSDFEAAKKTATTEKKDLLLDFTGSDWCGWCIRLDKEVFAKEPFKTKAPKDFVLVTVDFPQQKKLPEAVEKQNSDLQEKFRVEGFPTIYLADATGKPYAKTGYQAGGPEAYLTHLDELKKARVTRDNEFAAAEKAQGLEKAKHLKAGLDALDEEIVATHYEETVKQIEGLDKDDTLGLKKDRELSNDVQKLGEDIQGLAQEAKLDDIATKVDAFLKAHAGIPTKRRQQIMLMKLSAYNDPTKLDGAEKLVDEVIAVDEKSEVAEQARDLKSRIASIRKQQETKAKEAKDSEKPATDSKKKAE